MQNRDRMTEKRSLPPDIKPSAAPGFSRSCFPDSPVASRVMAPLGNRIIPSDHALTGETCTFLRVSVPNLNPKSNFTRPGRNLQWPNLDHFGNCPNFEQSLLKMVTRRKRWSTSAGSGWPRGSSLVVQVSGGAWRAQAASPRQSKSNPNFRGNRVDTIFRAGLDALLFFWWSRVWRPAPFLSEMRPARISFEMAPDSDPRCRVRRKLPDLPDWRGGLRRRATRHRGHVSIFLVCKQHGHAAFRTCVHRAAAKHKPLHALPERTQ